MAEQKDECRSGREREREREREMRAEALCALPALVAVWRSCAAELVGRERLPGASRGRERKEKGGAPFVRAKKGRS